MPWCGTWAQAVGKRESTRDEEVYGIDIDAEATERAKRNFSELAYVDHIELIAEDGLKAVERLEGPFDYVYLSIKPLQ